MRRRSLSSEDEALWLFVARSAKPLRPPDRREASTKNITPATPSLLEKGAERRAGFSPKRQDIGARQIQTGIDPRTIRRIARGAVDLDGRLDLHGFSQADAFERLHRFLAAVQADGGRLVLVITGKGAEGPGDRGVLRRALPHWLKSARFGSLVTSFQQAHRAHGGGGAFYVRLRRSARG